jgi:phosphoribosylamine-glycine ligase
MGAVASRQLVSPELLATIENEIVKPTVAGLRKENLPYRGFLYFGLMLTPTGPQIIEYNCRFGDPECQAVMPLVRGDLAGFCLAGAKGELRSNLISFDEGWSVCVILASAGYPDSSRNGDVISGIETVTDARVYHSGTKQADGAWQTNGGRVLAIVAGADDRESAVAKAHAATDKITFDGSQRRRDVGIFNF